MTSPGQNILKAENGSLNEAKAFAGVVLAAVASDRQISDQERQLIRSTLSRMRLFQGWSEEQYQTMISKLLKMLKDEGLDKFLEISACSLSSKFHPTAFAISVDLVLADGTVTREEKDFLYELQKILALEDDQAQKIIEVIIIKNRG